MKPRLDKKQKLRSTVGPAIFAFMDAASLQYGRDENKRLELTEAVLERLERIERGALSEDELHKVIRRELNAAYKRWLRRHPFAIVSLDEQRETKEGGMTNYYDELESRNFDEAIVRDFEDRSRTFNAETVIERAAELGISRRTYMNFIKKDFDNLILKASRSAAKKDGRNFFIGPIVQPETIEERAAELGISRRTYMRQEKEVAHSASKNVNGIGGGRR